MELSTISPLTAAPLSHPAPARPPRANTGHRFVLVNHRTPLMRKSRSLAPAVLPVWRCSAAAWAESKTVSHRARAHAGQLGARGRWLPRRARAFRAEQGSALNLHK